MLKEALNTLEQASDLPPLDNFVCILQKCRKVKDLQYAKCLHSHICNVGLDSHRVLGNYIVPMFVECGSVPHAEQVFSRLSHRTEHSWTSLILGYIQSGQSQHALSLYQKMKEDNVPPSRYTLVALLKACSQLKDSERGRNVHAEIERKGLEKDIFVDNTLVDMYAKCGLLSEAQEVFDRLQFPDVVSWTVLISGYAEYGPAEKALQYFEQMQSNGVSPDAVTLVSILKACSSIGSLDKGREIHALVKQKGFDKNMIVANSLVDMYVKCGSLVEAWNIFEKLPVKDTVTWNGLILGHAELGSGQEALNCFQQMQMGGIPPNVVTFICILKACGRIGAIDKGREMHMETRKKGFETDVFVCTTLIDMYAKCGALSEAHEVFDNMPVQTLVSWNAIINGYGMNEEINMAMLYFKKMLEQGVSPDAVTFTCLLSGCCRTKLIIKGQEYFMLMREEYGVVPTTDHCTCLVDLLARSGSLHEAEKFLETMPWLPSEETLTALLSACKNFGETALGHRCFKKLLQMSPGNSFAYVLMANIYTNAGRLDDAYRIEELRKLAGAKKKPASAMIEVNKKVHEFVVGDNQSTEIAAMLETMSSHMKEGGHVPNLDLILWPVSDEVKDATLCEHAEYLALAFGLLNTPHGKTLHVTKNLRMCNNCHNASKVLSRIEKREIRIRDSYSVHHFKDGSCSCSIVS